MTFRTWQLSGAGLFRGDEPGCLGRCGYNDYAVVEDLFELLRPADPQRALR